MKLKRTQQPSDKDYLLFWLKMLLKRRRNMMKAVVEKVSNGYIVTLYDELDDGSINECREVMQDDENVENGDPLKAGEEMLNTLVDYFGISGSRYDKERLRIKREQGDKFEDHLKEQSDDFNEKYEKAKNKIEVSECCKAKLKVISDGDLGQKEICTCHYECTACKRDCDSIWIDK